MSSGGRSFFAVALAVLAASGLWAPAALAEDDSYGRATCTFEGVATMGGDGVDSIADDLGDGGTTDLVTDSDPGTFDISSGSAACTGADTAGDAVGAIDSPSFSLSGGGTLGQGEFESMVCGTGKALIDIQLGNANGTDLTTKVSMNFSGGSGTVGIHQPEGRLVHTGGANDVDAGFGRGAVQLTVAPGAGDCVASNVTQIQFVGTTEFEFAGDGDDSDNFNWETLSMCRLLGRTLNEGPRSPLDPFSPQLPDLGWKPADIGGSALCWGDEPDELPQVLPWGLSAEMRRIIDLRPPPGPCPPRGSEFSSAELRGELRMGPPGSPSFSAPLDGEILKDIGSVRGFSATPPSTLKGTVELDIWAWCYGTHDPPRVTDWGIFLGVTKRF